MGLIWELIKELSDDENNKNKKTNDEHLEPWQKELVKKGEYDPLNFEENEELEEDDFFYDDDKEI